MNEIKNIAFIGSGNVAWHLAPALENCGLVVSEVYGRNKKTVNDLIARLYQATEKEDLDFTDSPANLIIIAVHDDSIEEIATEMVVREDTAVVHTSGTQPVSLLGFVATDHIGVFYPLQTFSINKSVDFREIPICLEAQSDELMDELKLTAEKLSREVIKMDTNDRKMAHLAAVFACNFTNHFLTITRDLLDRRGLEFSLLNPLIRETIQKALEKGPENSQTGPAIRNDHQIMEEHLSHLQNDEVLANLYEMISEDIIKRHGGKDE